MKREKELEQALRKLIEQTDQALNEGWIYTDEFRDKLDKARRLLPDKEEARDTYPDPSPSFHVVHQ